MTSIARRRIGGSGSWVLETATAAAPRREVSAYELEKLSGTPLKR